MIAHKFQPREHWIDDEERKLGLSVLLDMDMAAILRDQITMLSPLETATTPDHARICDSLRGQVAYANWTMENYGLVIQEGAVPPENGDARYLRREAQWLF
jgi:hypothetical protein